jgi:hypothetical protein
LNGLRGSQLELKHQSAAHELQYLRPLPRGKNISFRGVWEKAVPNQLSVEFSNLSDKMGEDINLELIIKCSSAKALESFLSIDDDKTWGHALAFFASYGNSSLCDWILVNKRFAGDVTWEGDTILHHALRGSNDRLFKQLMETMPVLVNTPGDGGITPLHIASTLETPTFFQQLVIAGADVNTADSEGKTALIYAILSSSPSFRGYISTLVQKGANVNVKDPKTGLYALHMEAGCADILEILLNGPQVVVDVRDSSKQTPLHLAVQLGSLDSIQILKSAGADPLALDAFDNSPWSIAKENRDDLIIHLLDVEKAIGDVEQPTIVRIHAELDKLRSRTAVHPELQSCWTIFLLPFQACEWVLWVNVVVANPR